MNQQDDKQEHIIPKLRFPEFKAALGWKHQKLGQVLKEPPKTAVKNPQDIELLTVKLHSRGIELTGKFPLKTEKGRPYYRRFQNEILVGRQNFHNGGLGIVKAEHDGKICSNAISSFNVKNDILEFIFKYISRKEYYTSVIDSLGGTGQKEIKKTHLLDLDIFIPTPEEQQKIADCLSSIDELIELQEQKLAALKQHKKGLMQQLFPSQNDLQASKQASKQIVYPKLRFPQFKDCKGWEIVELEELFDLTIQNEKTNSFDKDKIITVKLHTLGVVKNERTDTLTGGANYFHRKAGDFIFSKIDFLNGAFGIVPNELDGFCSSSDIPSFSFKPESNANFFMYWLKANYLDFKIERAGTSNTLKRISPKALFAMQLPIPLPEEQQAIADCLSSLDKLISEENEQIGRLKDHKKGLMQQLFPKIQ